MREPHKMVKHIQIIRWQQPSNCLSVFDHFVGLSLKGLSAFNLLLALKPVMHLGVLAFCFSKSWFWFLKVWFAGRFGAAVSIFTLPSLSVTLGNSTLHSDDWNSVIFFPFVDSASNIGNETLFLYGEGQVSRYRNRLLIEINCS